MLFFSLNLILSLTCVYNVFVLRTFRFRSRKEGVSVPLRLVDKNIVCFFFFFQWEAFPLVDVTVSPMHFLNGVKCKTTFFPAAKDILEDFTDKKVNFEFNNAVKGKPCLNLCLYNDNKACFAIQ